MLFIVTVNFNNKNGLRKTIASYDRIKCKNVHFVLVDGASDDGSVDVLETSGFGTNVSRVVEADLGTYDAMNKALRIIQKFKTTDKYVMFINSGDEIASISDDIIDNCKYNPITVGHALTDNGFLDRRYKVSLLRYGFMPFCHQSAIYNLNLISHDDMKYSLRTWSYNDYLQVATISKKYRAPVYINDILSVYEQQTSTGISRSSYKYKFEKLSIVYQLFGLMGIIRMLYFKLNFNEFDCDNKT